MHGFECANPKMQKVWAAHPPKCKWSPPEMREVRRAAPPGHIRGSGKQRPVGSLNDAVNRGSEPETAKPRTRGVGGTVEDIVNFDKIDYKRVLEKNAQHCRRRPKKGDRFASNKTFNCTHEWREYVKDNILI